MDNLDALEADLRERAGKYDEYDWHGAAELKAADCIRELRAELARSRNAEYTPCMEIDHANEVRFLKEDCDSLRASLAAVQKDKERLDWIEQQHTLHKAVEFLYVVDGYQAELTYDDNPVAGPYHGETLRAAIDAASAERSVDRGTTRSTKEPVK